jgi:hypothetical protein
MPGVAHDGRHGGRAHEATAHQDSRVARPLLQSATARRGGGAAGRALGRAGQLGSRARLRAERVQGLRHSGEESASRFHETVDIVLKAWTNGQCLVPVSDPPCAILIEVRMRRLLGTFPRPKLPKSTRIAVMLAWQLRRSQIALANSRGSTLGFSHRSERHAISRRRRAAGQGRWPIWLQPKRNGCLQTTKRINKPSGGSR